MDVRGEQARDRAPCAQLLEAVRLADRVDSAVQHLRTRPGREGAVHAFVVRALQGEKILIHNEGDQIRSWCYIDDIVRAIELAMVRDESVGESFNIGNSRSTVTIYQLAQLIVRLTESKSPIEFIEWDFTDVELRIPDVKKAEKLLGFRANVDLEEGLLRTIEWYRRKLSGEG